MGIKRGRKALGKKQINIRLLPEHYSLLEAPNPLFVHYRKKGVKMHTDKHGSSPGFTPSNIVAKLIHDKMLKIVRRNPESIIDFAERYTVHPRWLRIAYEQTDSQTQL